MNKQDMINEFLKIDNLKNYFIDEEENNRVIEYADQISEHIFSFTKPWDMERCSKPFQLPSKINWNLEMNDDEEWTFMLNRMSYLRDLVIAFIITDNDKYSLKCKTLILDWTEAHPTIEYSKSTRTLDTAIRIETIFEACIFLNHFKALTENEYEEIMNNIRLQVEYMRENYIPKYRLSNWGSIQTATILSLCPYLYEEKNILEKWAEKELYEQLEIQINENGMHWEQSTMYHVEVLDSLLKLVQYRQYLNIPCEEKLIRKIIEMTDALFQLTYPNGLIENFGDSDRTCTDDIFVKATAILKMNRWKIKDYKKDYESILTLGVKSLNDYARLGINKNFRLNCIDQDAGIYLLKQGGENTYSSTMFVNGTLGSGHGHCDNLHVSLCYNGEFILVDSGRYTYREDHELRPYLKSMMAHNTVVLDNDPHSIPNGSWGMEEFCKPLKNTHKSAGEIHYIEGGLVASKQGLMHLRKLIVIDCGIWMIVDEIVCLGKHIAKSFFHFDPEINIELGERLISITSNKNTCVMIVNGEKEVHKEMMSLHYNELTEHQVVTVENTFTDLLVLPIILCDKNILIEEVEVIQGTTVVSDKGLLTARKFRMSNELSYTVIVFHKEVYKGQKIFSCEGVSFHGQTVVIKEENSTKMLTVLRH